MTPHTKTPKARYIDSDNHYLEFFCPGCNETHHVPVKEGMGWSFNGDLVLPTLSPSIKVEYRHPKGHSNENPAPVGYDGEFVTDVCHSFVRDGRIEYLNDCTHEYAGKTVELPDIEPS